jgi:hypothetical protein
MIARLVPARTVRPSSSVFRPWRHPGELVSVPNAIGIPSSSVIRRLSACQAAASRARDHELAYAAAGASLDAASERGARDAQ